MHGSSEANSSLTLQLKEQLQYLATSMNTGSSIVQKLSENEKCCDILHRSLTGIIPTIENLNSSIKTLDDKELDITQQMERLGKSITEINIPDKVELLPVEPCTHAQEKLELERQVQNLVANLEFARENLKEKECHNEEINNALFEALRKVEETETHAKQFKSQIVELEDRAKTIEINVREELNRASIVARDEHKKKFEQQLHKAMREKAELEINLSKLQEQLADSHRDLVLHSSRYPKLSLMAYRLKKRSPPVKRRQKLKIL